MCPGPPGWETATPRPARIRPKPNRARRFIKSRLGMVVLRSRLAWIRLKTETRSGPSSPAKPSRALASTLAKASSTLAPVSLPFGVRLTSNLRRSFFPALAQHQPRVLHLGQNAGQGGRFDEAGFGNVALSGLGGVHEKIYYLGLSGRKLRAGPAHLGQHLPAEDRLGHQQPVMKRCLHIVSFLIIRNLTIPHGKHILQTGFLWYGRNATLTNGYHGEFLFVCNYSD